MAMKPYFLSRQRNNQIEAIASKLYPASAVLHVSPVFFLRVRTYVQFPAVCTLLNFVHQIITLLTLRLFLSSPPLLSFPLKNLVVVAY